MKQSASEETVERPWYDTKEGIEKSLNSLNSFHKLITARYEATHDREEMLHEIYILGRFCLTPYGQCKKIHKYIPKEELPKIPDVLLVEDFWDYIEKHTGTIPSVMINMNKHDLIAPTGFVCPECKKEWGVHDCHDVVVVRETITQKAFFIGSTFKEAVIGYSKSDPSAKLKEKKWVPRDDCFEGDYIIQEGDEITFNILSYFHSSCRHRHLVEKDKQAFENIFQQNNIDIINITETAQESCDSRPCSPLFGFETNLGIILLGWKDGCCYINWNDIATKVSFTKDIAINPHSLFTEYSNIKDGSSILANDWKEVENILFSIAMLLTETEERIKMKEEKKLEKGNDMN